MATVVLWSLSLTLGFSWICGGEAVTVALIVSSLNGPGLLPVLAGEMVDKRYMPFNQINWFTDKYHIPLSLTYLWCRSNGAWRLRVSFFTDALYRASFHTFLIPS